MSTVLPVNATRVGRRAALDKAIDELYEALAITRGDIFETATLLERVYREMPKWSGDAYFQISIAWTDVSDEVRALLRLLPDPENMWDFHRQIAAASILLRMQARSLPLFEPIDNSNWIYLGSMRFTGGGNLLVDLWGKNDWRTLKVRGQFGDLDGEHDLTCDSQLPTDPYLAEAAHRLAHHYRGPDY